jgi:pyridoxal phosphate enzyme (YggS family)
MEPMVTASPLAENYARVEQEIAAACRAAGRSRAEVAMIAVTKTHPAAVVEEAIALGMQKLGENRVQEWQGKRAELSTSALEAVEAHLIGHLQSNKSARAVELFQSVDTLDSLKLAQRLNTAASEAAGQALPVVLEIKLSAEESKEGLAPAGPELQQLLEQLPDLRFLKLRGLMTVPPFLQDMEAVRPYFRRLRDLRDRLAQAHPRLSFETLSMGMSHDFAVAIEEGSTEIRVGTALFGARTPATV